MAGRMAGTVLALVAFWGGVVSAQEAAPPNPERLAATRLVEACDPDQRAAQIPVDKLPRDHQASVRDVLKKPTVYCRGGSEAFPCRPAIYDWLLDHPQHGVTAWQAAGAPGVTLERKPDGSFIGTDDNGGELRFHPLLTEANRRIWYVEGSGKPLPLVPATTVKAVLVLHYSPIKGPDGRAGIQHQTELFCVVEGKAVGLLARLWGMPVESAAKKALEQVETFFSGMAWYLSEHPAFGHKVFDPAKIKDKTAAKQVEALLKELEKVERK